MPHVTARMPEAQLVGRESALITALTDAVVQVYGEWARDLVVVHLDGIPQGRWGIGGRAPQQQRDRGPARRRANRRGSGGPAPSR